MANFDRSGMTQAGINLMGKAVGGATIQFTKLVLGDGTITGEILDLQGVVSPKQNVDVTRIERNDNQCTVGGELLTSSVKQGFFWRECGLYAMDPDQGEILYNYAYSTKPDFIAASDSGMMEEILVSMIATVGSNTNVDVTIDDSMVFATKKLVDKKPYYYNCVSDMESDGTLKNGDMAITLGYHAPNDGGGAEYHVQASDVARSGKIFNLVVDGTVNVKKLGAKGDGVADDTAVFKKAIAYLKAKKGGILYVPVGTYIISETLIVDFSKFKICGDGKNSVIKLDLLDAEKGFHIYSCSQFRMSDLMIEHKIYNGNAVNFKGTAITLGDFVSSTNRRAATTFYITDIYVRGFDVGIEYNSGWCSDFDKLEVSNNRIGLQIGNDKTDPIGLNITTISNSSISYNGDYNVLVYVSDRLNFYGCTIEGSEETISIKIKNSEDVLFSGCYFERNKIAMQIAIDEGDLVKGITMDGFKNTANKFTFGNVQKVKLTNFRISSFKMFEFSNKIRNIDINPGNNYTTSLLESQPYPAIPKNLYADTPIISPEFKFLTKKNTSEYKFIHSDLLDLSSSATYHDVTLENSNIVIRKKQDLASSNILRANFRIRPELFSYIRNKGSKFISFIGEISHTCDDISMIQIKYHVTLNDNRSIIPVDSGFGTQWHSTQKNVIHRITNHMDLDDLCSKMGCVIGDIAHIGVEFSIVSNIPLIQDDQLTIHKLELYNSKFTVENTIVNHQESSNKPYMSVDYLETKDIYIKGQDNNIYKLSINAEGQLTPIRI